MVGVRCEIHPRYQAVRPPRTACKWCLMMYALVRHSEAAAADAATARKARRKRRA